MAHASFLSLHVRCGTASSRICTTKARRLGTFAHLALIPACRSGGGDPESRTITVLLHSNRFSGHKLILCFLVVLHNVNTGTTAGMPRGGSSKLFKTIVLLLPTVSSSSKKRCTSSFQTTFVRPHRIPSSNGRSQRWSKRSWSGMQPGFRTGSGAPVLRLTIR